MIAAPQCNHPSRSVAQVQRVSSATACKRDAEKKYNQQKCPMKKRVHKDSPKSKGMAVARHPLAS
jgi:hypothetical protein